MACTPRGSSVRMVKAMVMFSSADTHSRPSSSASRLSSSAGTEAGIQIPHPSGRRAAKRSIGTARITLPVIFWAMIRA